MIRAPVISAFVSIARCWPRKTASDGQEMFSAEAENCGRDAARRRRSLFQRHRSGLDRERTAAALTFAQVPRDTSSPVSFDGFNLSGTISSLQLRGTWHGSGQEVLGRGATGALVCGARFVENNMDNPRQAPLIPSTNKHSFSVVERVLFLTPEAAPWSA